MAIRLYRGSLLGTVYCIIIVIVVIIIIIIILLLLVIIIIIAVIIIIATVEPLYNLQVGAGAFVRYSEVSFIGRFHHIMFI